MEKEMSRREVILKIELSILALIAMYFFRTHDLFSHPSSQEKSTPLPTEINVVETDINVPEGEPYPIQLNRIGEISVNKEIILIRQEGNPDTLLIDPRTFNGGSQITLRNGVVTIDNENFTYRIELTDVPGLVAIISKQRRNPDAIYIR